MRLNETKKGNIMKTCPICNANTFDDMEVCYGCMFEFKNDHSYTISDNTCKTQEYQIEEMTPLSIYDKTRPEYTPIYTVSEFWEFINYRNALIKEFALRQDNNRLNRASRSLSDQNVYSCDNIQDKQAKCYKKLAQSIGLTLQLTVDEYSGDIQIENIYTARGRHGLLCSDNEEEVVRTLSLEA